MRRFGFFVLFACCACAAPDAAPPAAPSIYWSDGDSGRIDGTAFRLANVDAPETGGVGSVGGAQCEAERALGYDAKAFMAALTRDSELQITARYGADRYGRDVVDLSAGGDDVAQKGIAAGHLRPWPHRGRTALSDKPDWCAQAP